MTPRSTIELAQPRAFPGIVFSSNKTKWYALCSLYISRAVSCFCEKEFEIYAVFVKFSRAKQIHTSTNTYKIILFCALHCIAQRCVLPVSFPVDLLLFPPERKLAKRTSVQCKMNYFRIIFLFFSYESHLHRANILQKVILIIESFF